MSAGAGWTSCRPEHADVLIVAVGPHAAAATAADLLLGKGVSCTVVDPGWVFRVPAGLSELAADHQLVITAEDGVRVDGFGTRVLQLLSDERVDTPVQVLGLPPQFLPPAPLVSVQVGEGVVDGEVANPLAVPEVELCSDDVFAAPIVSTLHVPARLAVSGYVAGGRAAARRPQECDYDPLGSARVKPTGRDVAGACRRLCEVARINVTMAYEVCERITRQEARNFSYGIRLHPREKRQVLSAVYATARRIDDIGDGALCASEKSARLEATRARLHALASEPPKTTTTPDTDPVLVALADAAHRFPIPLPAFDELIDGCQADVDGREYVTADQLVHYCRCVAGSVGRLTRGLYAPPGYDAAAPLADALGVALQLTNILRDIREDRLFGRIYLPRRISNASDAGWNWTVMATSRTHPTGARRWFATRPREPSVVRPPS